LKNHFRRNKNKNYGGDNLSKDKATKETKTKGSPTLLKIFDMVDDRELQIIKLQYTKDVGLIVCALNDFQSTGWLK